MISNFKEIVKNSKTYNELYKKTGVGILKLKKIIIEQHIDTTHFTPGIGKSTRSKLLDTKKICPVCQQEFITKWKKQVTCGYSCSNSYFRSEENHPNWKPYSEKKRKNDVYKRICFKHHKHECIICKESVVIDVHHFDANCSNNSPQNLVPLCPTHHRYLHCQAGKDLIYDKVIAYVEHFKTTVN
jgi:hypothetical protein